MSPRILLLEDDTQLGQLIETEIKQRGYEVSWCQTLLEAEKVAQTENFSLGIIDLYLPDGMGFDFIEKEQSFPMIMMSALGDPENRLKAAQLGIVDFIPKPFLMDELFLKVSKFVSSEESGSGLWVLGNVKLDMKKRQVVSEGEVHLLNKRDFGLLKVLTLNFPGVVSRDQIMDHVYGVDSQPSLRTIDNAVVGIRQMLKDDGQSWIRSVRGEGYQWLVEESAHGE